MLQANGLITVRPGHGVFVADYASANEQPFSRWESQYNYRVEELFEARLTIEPLAAARAATRAEQHDLQALATTLVDFERGVEKGDLAAMVLADSDFHSAVARASRNRLFQTMLRSVHYLLIESQRASLSPAERPRRVLAKHQAIHAAIVAGDAHAAELAMRDHLMTFVSEMGVINPAYMEGSP